MMFPVGTRILFCRSQIIRMLIQKRILRIACILCKTVHVKFVHILNRRLGAGGIVKRYFVRIRFTQITDFKRQPAIYDGQFSIQW